MERYDMECVDNQKSNQAANQIFKGYLMAEFKFNII